MTIVRHASLKGILCDNKAILSAENLIMSLGDLSKPLPAAE